MRGKPRKMRILNQIVVDPIKINTNRNEFHVSTMKQYE